MNPKTKFSYSQIENRGSLTGYFKTTDGKVFTYRITPDSSDLKRAKREVEAHLEPLRAAQNERYSKIPADARTVGDRVREEGKTKTSADNRDVILSEVYARQISTLERELSMTMQHDRQAQIKRRLLMLRERHNAATEKESAIDKQDKLSQSAPVKECVAQAEQLYAALVSRGDVSESVVQSARLAVDVASRGNTIRARQIMDSVSAQVDAEMKAYNDSISKSVLELESKRPVHPIKPEVMPSEEPEKISSPYTDLLNDLKALRESLDAPI